MIGSLIESKTVAYRNRLKRFTAYFNGACHSERSEESPPQRMPSAKSRFLAALGMTNDNIRVALAV